MPTHKIAIKRPNEPLQQMAFEGTYRSDVAPLIGNNDPHTYLQFVVLHQSGTRCLAFACDEDGLMKQLPPNFQMLTYSGNHSFYETIVGNIVFLVYRLEDTLEQDIWDFKLEDLNDGDLKFVENLLSSKTQARYKKIAEIDPSITKTPTMFFDPIDNIEEFLGITPPLLCPIPSFLIPSHLFTKWPVEKPLTFFADRKGVVKYTTGIRRGRAFAKELEIYCESKVIAHDMSITQQIGSDGISKKDAMDLLARYLQALHDWGVPPVVYVTKETEGILQKQ